MKTPTVNPPKTILLLSGGLDSVTLLYDLHSNNVEVHCLTIDYDQPHRREIDFARHHCDRMGVRQTLWKIPALGGLTDGNWIVPNRNAIFISLAVSLAVTEHATHVAIAANAADAEVFFDCRPDFLEAMRTAVHQAGWSIQISAPYLRQPKWWILGRARNLGVDVGAIWTCYLPGPEPCGKCPACEKLNTAKAHLEV